MSQNGSTGQNFGLFDPISIMSLGSFSACRATGKAAAVAFEIIRPQENWESDPHECIAVNETDLGRY